MPSPYDTDATQNVPSLREEAFVEQEDGRFVSGPSLPDPQEPRRGSPLKRRLVAAAAAATLVVLGVAGLVALPDGEDVRAAGPKQSPPQAQSFGISQAQLDKLGESIMARYASGDTEVAQALLDNFMAQHPECVAAVAPGGEGSMRAVLAQAEAVAKEMRATSPYPNAYTTVITVRDKGVVKAAVLGVACEAAQDAPSLGEEEAPVG